MLLQGFRGVGGALYAAPMTDTTTDSTAFGKNDLVLYELRNGVATITLNRPSAANAQDRAVTYALDEAFSRFATDDNAAVAILRGEGKHFSSGHDTSPHADFTTNFPLRTLWWEHKSMATAEGIMAFEEEAWLGMCFRWRELPKPTIALVTGACIGGGLALAWACDFIVASTDAFFSDPVLTMGCPGIEFFCHPYALGTRRAKEFLFTGERLPAQRAYELGMVNHVWERDEIVEQTTKLAERIAERSRFALALAKKAVNVAEEGMGLRTGIEHAFALHSLSHAHNLHTCGMAVQVMDPKALRKASE